MGRQFIIRSDHQALKWLFNVKDPSSKLLGWRLKLEEYDYTIEYMRGKENKVADCLSRVQPIQEKTDHQTIKTSDVPSVSEHASNTTDKN